MTGAAQGQRGLVGVDLAVFAALLMSISAVLSLVTIISIYREGGILKRLRATPLRPLTILTAHVLVKLLFTAITVTMMTFLGKRYLPVDIPIPWVAFTAATLVSTLSILSLGFVLASLAPTARFAQPIGTIVLYPMIGISGLFMPVEDVPALQLVAHVTPASYAVSLMRGAWYGDSWLHHGGDLLALGSFSRCARRWPCACFAGSREQVKLTSDSCFPDCLLPSDLHTIGKRLPTGHQCGGGRHGMAFALTGPMLRIRVLRRARDSGDVIGRLRQEEPLGADHSGRAPASRLSARCRRRFPRACA